MRRSGRPMRRCFYAVRTDNWEGVKNNGKTISWFPEILV
jgi:hypothetical protein